MKEAHIGIFVCLLLILVVTQTGHEAQETGEPAPKYDVVTGEGMDEVAETVVKGLIERDMNTVWDNLAPWLRNRFVLFADSFRIDHAMKTLTDEEAKEISAWLDPKGHLEIESAGDVRALSNAEFFGLLSGTYARDWDHRGRAVQPDQIKQTQRHVGLVEVEADRHKLQQWTAIVEYEPGLFDLELVPTPDGWVISEMDCGAFVGPSFSLKLTKAVDDPLHLAHETSWSGLQELRKEEAELMFSSIKGQLRVEYAKAGNAEDAAEPFLKLVENGECEGRHYRITDFHHGLKESKFDAALTAKPNRMVRMNMETVDPHALFLFNWMGGESEVEWFETESELNKRLEELRGEQADPPEEKKQPGRRRNFR